MTGRVGAIVGAIAMLLVAPLARSAGQAPSSRASGPPGVIVVQVTDTSCNPLPAEVVLRAFDVGTRLADDGTAMLVDVPDGLHLVEVRHAGYASESRLVRVTGDTVRADFALAPIAAEGARTADRGGRNIARARLRYFVARTAAISRGVFITRGEVERRGARTVSALLDDVRGISVERAPRGRTIVRSAEASEQPCAGGMLVFVDRAPVAPIDDSGPDAAAERHSRAGQQGTWRLTAGGGSTGSPTLRWVGPSGGDFVRVAHNAVQSSQPGAVRRVAVTDIDRVKVSSVVAVEIYSSPGSTPPEFQVPGAECGVVLIWTAGA